MCSLMMNRQDSYVCVGQVSQDRSAGKEAQVTISQFMHVIIISRPINWNHFPNKKRVNMLTCKICKICKIV